MAILNPYHLLEQAERLLEPRQSGRNPALIRQVDRRRAISAAYYAVFHAILAQIADKFVGRELRKTSRYALAYRHVGHDQLERLSNQVIKQKPEKKYQPHFPEDGFDDAIRKFASLAVELKGDRNSSDYDPAQRVKMAEAKVAISQAKLAIDLFSTAPLDQRDIFLTLLAFPPR